MGIRLAVTGGSLLATLACGDSNDAAGPREMPGGTTSMNSGGAPSGGSGGTANTSSGGSGGENTPMERVEACTGPDSCAGERTCVGDVCDACICPEVTQDCVGAFNCAGTQTCQPGGSCDACECTTAPETWKATGTGKALELATDGSGNAYVLLSTSPWVVRHSGETGAIESVTVESDLSWTTTSRNDDGTLAVDLAVQEDGSFAVGGLGGTAGVRVDRFTATGDLVISAELPLEATDEGREYGGLSRAPNGEFYVAVDVYHTDTGDRTWEVFSIGTAGPPASVSVPNVPVLSIGSPFFPTAIAVDEGGAVAWGSQTYLDVAVQIGTTITPLADLGILGTLASDGQGGWIVSFGDEGSPLGTYFRALTRFDSTGAEQWRVTDDTAPPEGSNVTVSATATSAAVLDDSVIVTSPHGTFASADGVPMRGARVDLNGTVVQTFFEDEGATYVAPVGTHGVIFLTRDSANGYSLARVEFEPL